MRLNLQTTMVFNLIGLYTTTKLLCLSKPVSCALGRRETRIEVTERIETETKRGGYPVLV